MKESAKILAVVSGSSANKGQDVAFILGVSIQQEPFELPMFIAHDLVPVLINHLMTYAGMARNTRISNNPAEESDGSLSGANALILNDVLYGVSLTDKTHAILNLQYDAGKGRLLNGYCAAQKPALIKLRDACNQALEALDNPANAPSINQIN